MKKAAFLLLTFALCINHVFGDDNFNHPTDTIFINPLAQNSSQTGTRQNPWLGFKSPYSMPDHKTYAIKGGTTIYTTSTVQFLGHELVTITSYDTTGVGPARIYKTTPDARLMYVSGSEDGPNGININAVVRVKDLILYHVGRHSVNDNTGETLTIRMYGGKAIVDNVHTTGGHQGINISGYSTPDIVDAYVMNCSIDSTFDDSMYHSRLKSLHILNCKTSRCGLFWPDHLVQPNGDGTQTWEVRNILIENSTLDRSATGGKFAVIGTETLSQYHIKNSLLIGHFFENRPGIDSISAVVYKGNGSWIFENSIIVDARFGIWNFGTNLQIDNCLFVGQNIAIQALTANNTIINSTFANIGKRQYYYPQNSVFHEASGSQVLNVSNCNFVNYNRLFLAIGSSVVKNFTGNNYFNYAVNEAGQYGTAFTSVDPLFEEEIYYQLSEQSPLKNAGPNGRDVGFSLIESGPVGYKGLIKANGSGTNNTQFTISLSANPVSAGTLTGGGTFIQGTQATVTATANTGYSFVNWKEGNTVVSTNPSYSFEVTANRNLTANFQTIQYTISASSNPTQGGSISGAGSYNHGAQVSLTATANTGYSFVNWKEGSTVVSTNASYSFTASANRTLTANFSQQQYVIAASANPVEGGSTTGAGSYNHGAQVSLTATANTGWNFISWLEDGTMVSTSPVYEFLVTESRNLTASFSQSQYGINLTAEPAEGGSLSGGGAYNYGQTATVVAQPNSGWEFNAWLENGIVVSQDNEYSFEVTGNRSLSATFSQSMFQLSLQASPEEGGSVSGDGSFTKNSMVSVMASPNNGWVFLYWTEEGAIISNSPEYEFMLS
ncbi:MAG: hypothetical protein GX587_13035, partial [Bacteroidales bacterium]|nr:hypothetical protein [Bacteroidales bacterium]